MVQALIATIIELMSLIFALGAGAFLEESKSKEDANARRGAICIILSLMLAACAMGVASR